MPQDANQGNGQDQAGYPFTSREILECGMSDQLRTLFSAPAPGAESPEATMRRVLRPCADQAELERIRNVRCHLSLANLHTDIDRLAAKDRSHRLPANYVLAFCEQFLVGQALHADIDRSLLPNREFEVTVQMVRSRPCTTSGANGLELSVPVTTLHMLLDRVAEETNGADERNLRLGVLAEVSDLFVAAVVSLSARLTFYHLRLSLDQPGDRPLQQLYASTPDLAPLVSLGQRLAPGEIQLIANASDQPASLTVGCLRQVIDDMDHQIVTVPNGCSPLRALLERMNQVAKNAKELA
jgi:hypothetical protein